MQLDKPHEELTGLCSKVAAVERSTELVQSTEFQVFSVDTPQLDDADIALQSTEFQVFSVDTPELDDADIDVISKLMKQTYGYLCAGLQSPGMGQFARGLSLPRFTAAYSDRFVQVLNVGDHWICVSNAFGNSSHDVYVYDSMYESVNQQTIIQVTSLLRGEDEPDQITFHIRNFKQQKAGSRACGFYAVAACVSCYVGQDPSGFVYDEENIVIHYRWCVENRDMQPFPVAYQEHGHDIRVISTEKLHCRCQGKSKGLTTRSVHGRVRYITFGS
jgi:hypothetical protein